MFIFRHCLIILKQYQSMKKKPLHSLYTQSRQTEINWIKKVQIIIQIQCKCSAYYFFLNIYLYFIMYIH